MDAGIQISGSARHARLSDAARTFKLVMPSSVGFALAHTCFSTIVNDSSAYRSGSLLTDGATLITLALLACLMVLLLKKRSALTENNIKAINIACVALQCLAAAGLTSLETLRFVDDSVRLACNVLLTASSLCVMFYWLRNAKGASSPVAATIVLTALIISELLLCVFSLLPQPLSYLPVIAMALGQFGCMQAARKSPLPSTIQTARRATGYFNLAKTMMDSQHFLAISAVGIWLIAAAQAVIRMFPTGHPIPFTPVTLVLYLTLCIALSLTLMVRSFNEERSTMTVGFWIVLQGLGAAALVLCSVLPGSLDVGLAFAFALNGLLFAFVGYVTIAFMSYGTYDPYYYAFGGMISLLLPRSLTTLALPALSDNIANPLALASIAGAFLLISAQFVFAQLLRARGKDGDSEDRPLSHAAGRALGIEGHIDTSVAMRTAIMKGNTNCLKEQFLLSERETEVLTLYALGHTQDKIAEELYLSPGTVHTYIKRIYGKTNLHSRQDILDYIERYIG
ncbi:MAG: LuxR C-terminal-related transcriptional regulator [Gordonibacter sp.]|nr:LuxR C-terminal-related transcriptional regulator [Gordonibacter sp.]